MNPPQHWIEVRLVAGPIDYDMELVCEDPERCSSQTGAVGCHVMEEFSYAGITMLSMSEGDVEVVGRLPVDWAWDGTGEDATMRIEINSTKGQSGSLQEK